MFEWQRELISERQALKLGVAELGVLLDRCKWGYQNHGREAELPHRLIIQAYGGDPDRYFGCLMPLLLDHLQTAVSSLWQRGGQHIYQHVSALGLPSLPNTLAYHGEHDVDTTSLRSLQLMPVKGCDGRLYYLDALSANIDMCGLSKLEFSACETGLGRIDGDGNLFGIAA
jgi:hypothetical protein